jgi:ArsR family transcriptional regulator
VHNKACFVDAERTSAIWPKAIFSLPAPVKASDSFRGFCFDKNIPVCYYLDSHLTIYMDSIFKALADPNRREILSLLRKEDMTVSELHKHFSITMPSLSHHLDILKRANLVIDERQGQYKLYSINTSVFEEVVNTFMNYFS